jgi:ribonuclease D
MTSLLQVNSFPIVYASTQEEIKQIAVQLKNVQQIGFDTEFDKFKRRYGFTLLLLQLFDGEKVYIIKVNAESNLAPLKPIFESEKILKIGFSLGEDIFLLKSREWEVKNVIDLQVVCRFTPFTSHSFAAVCQEVLKVQIDKSKQTSNWFKELDYSQIIYAANDVLHLFRLNQKLFSNITNPIYYEYIKQEMQEMMNANSEDISLKLKGVQKNFSEKEKMIVLEIKEVIHQIAKSIDRPAHNVVSEDVINLIVKRYSSFESIILIEGCIKMFKKNKHIADAFDEAVRKIIAKYASQPDTSTVIKGTKKPKIITERYAEIKHKFCVFLLQMGFSQHVVEVITTGLKSHVMGEKSKKYTQYKLDLFNDFIFMEDIRLENLFEQS